MRDITQDDVRVLPNDVVEIFGVMYAGELFRSFGLAPIGAILRIINRADGVVTVERLADLEAP